MFCWEELRDTSRPYRAGHTHETKRGAHGWPPMDACFFAFDTPLKALEAAFPKDSKALKHPRVLVKLESKGNAYECHQVNGMSSRWTGKIALTKVKVTRIMTDAFMRTRGESEFNTLRYL